MARAASGAALRLLGQHAQLCTQPRSVSAGILDGGFSARRARWGIQPEHTLGLLWGCTWHQAQLGEPNWAPRTERPPAEIFWLASTGAARASYLASSGVQACRAFIFSAERAGGPAKLGYGARTIGTRMFGGIAARGLERN